MKNPCVSIVTVNLNNNEGLLKTAKSIISQSAFDKIEWIIIDGGSEDGSLDTIAQFSASLDYWVSERDTGVYNAMNKGIKKASGEYVLFMNSGDCIYDDDVIARFIESDLYEKYDYIIGRLASTLNDKIISFEDPPFIENAMHIIRGNIPHQATFIRRRRFNNQMYDERYKVVADKKFFFYDMVFNQASYSPMYVNVARFDTQGISCSGNPIVKEELQRYVKETLPPLICENYEKWLVGENKLQKLLLKLPEKSMDVWLLSMMAKCFCTCRSYTARLCRLCCRILNIKEH